MKKRLLFVMNNLNCGGAEKALISLLHTIDYSKYEVDLYLFKHEGMFLNQLPKEVVLLDEPLLYGVFDMSIKRALIKTIKNRKPKLAISRVLAGVVFKTEKNRAICEQRVWKYASKSLNKLNKEYDAAIGYLEKSPIYFVIDKVNAHIKLGFIHNDYDKLGMDPGIDSGYFEKLNYIVTVSEECVNILRDRFPQYREKIVLMHNILMFSAIHEMSKEYHPFTGSEITIVSVGRLNYQKGFDLAVDACDLLIKDGYNIKWYVVGEGEERENLERKIRKLNLQEKFILAGMKENPYPYINNCDIYVQSSLFEGRCLTITEAKILKKPIVSTNFNVIYDQLENGRNGIIVEQNANSLYQGVKRLLDDQRFCELLISHLSEEKWDNGDEMNKLYQWIS